MNFSKVKLTTERLIAAASIIFALIILCASRGMSMTARYSVGPALLPVACAILLIFFSVMVWVTSRDDKRVTWALFCTQGAQRCFLLIGLTVAAILALYFFGLWIPLFAYSVLCFYLVEKHPLSKSVLMSGVWVVFIYVLFVHLLRMNISTY